jgi:2,3-bisphosphoglycerate-dependent phosphoglycerate mutase
MARARWRRCDRHEPSATRVRDRRAARGCARTEDRDPEIDEGVAEYDAHSGEYIPIEELRELKDERWYATIEGRWTDVGGIDPHEFQARVVPAVETLIERHAGRRLAVVAHGGMINVYLAHVLGLDRMLWFHPEYTSISRVNAARSGQRSLATLNETAHLVGARDALSAEGVS